MRNAHPIQPCHPLLGAAGMVAVACCLAAAPTALAGAGSGVEGASGAGTTTTGEPSPGAPSGSTTGPSPSPVAPPGGGRSGPSGGAVAPPAPAGGGDAAARMRNWNRRLRQEASRLAGCLSALDAFDRRVIVLRAGIDSRASGLANRRRSPARRIAGRSGASGASRVNRTRAREPFNRLPPTR